MRRVMVAVALAAALASTWAAPMSAQQNGVVIQNNGVDSTHNAAGADNVRVSRAPGNSSSTDVAGLSNEAGRVVKEKNRNRKDRDSRNASEEMAAPVEEAPAAAPAEGDYQAYSTDGSEWVEPAVQDLAPEPALDPNLPVQLPNTGVGAETFTYVSVIVAAVSAALATIAARRRFVS